MGISPLWTMNGSNMYNNNLTGNVGIGLANPGANLQVSGNFIAGNTNNGYYGILSFNGQYST
ncbi:MAG: hypothetical protein WCH65_00730 [bacterium]